MSTKESYFSEIAATMPAKEAVAIIQIKEVVEEGLKCAGAVSDNEAIAIVEPYFKGAVNKYKTADNIFYISAFITIFILMALRFENFLPALFGVAAFVLTKIQKNNIEKKYERERIEVVLKAVSLKTNNGYEKASRTITESPFDVPPQDT